MDIKLATIALLKTLYDWYPTGLQSDSVNKPLLDSLVDLGFAELVIPQRKPGAPPPSIEYQITTAGRKYIESMNPA